MSHLRFNHVFVFLMLLAGLTAFAMPAKYANRTPQVAALFAPIARPTGALAGWIHRRVAPDPTTDPRPDQVIRRENEELKASVESLTLQLDDLRQRDIERGKLGNLRDLCTPWTVAAADSGNRESISLRGSSLEGLKGGMFVLYPSGVVGQIDRAGVAGAQIRLITDQGFRLRGSFGTFARRPDNSIEFVKLPAPQGLVEGVGENTMMVTNLTLDQVKAGNIREGDWVILSEPDWPPFLQGQPLGKVVAINKRRGAPLFAAIKIQPPTNLMRLREVMVVTKEK